MKAKSSWWRVMALCTALALVAAACGGDSGETADGGDVSEETTPQVDEANDQEDAGDAEADAADEPVEPQDDEGGEGDAQEAAGDADQETQEVPEPVEAPEVDEPDPAEVDDAIGTSPAFIDTDPSSEFCVAARDLEANDPIAGLSPFDAEFFGALDGIYASLEPLAPAELEGDVTVIREFLAEIIPIFATNDIFSPEATEALASLDDPALEVSGERFDAYLTDVCGVVSTPGSGDGGGAAETETLDETISLDGAGVFTGMLESGTYDLYQIEAVEGSTLTVTMESGTEFGLDPTLVVVDPIGATVENDDADTAAGLAPFDSQVIIDSTVSGLYSIETHSFFGEGSGEFILTIEVS